MVTVSGGGQVTEIPKRTRLWFGIRAWIAWCCDRWRRCDRCGTRHIAGQDHQTGEQYCLDCKRIDWYRNYYMHLPLEQQLAWQRRDPTLPLGHPRRRA
jgi:hypothetical protein